MSDRKYVTLRYVAIIVRDPDADAPYCAAVPDLGACFAVGNTAEEAKASLPDALAPHIEGMRAAMVAMPPARHRDEILLALDHDVVEDYVIEIEIEPLARSIHHVATNGRTRLS